MRKDFSLGLPLKDRGINLSRYPNAPFPHRCDLCFYHQAFGKDALKCNIGCAWENRTGKAVPQEPVKPFKPYQSIQNIPPNPSTTGATTSSNPPKNA